MLIQFSNSQFIHTVIPGHASLRGPGIHTPYANVRYRTTTRWLWILRCAIAHRSSRKSAPRNDEREGCGRNFTFSRHHAPEFCSNHFAPSEKRAQGDPQERAQGMPGARCTHGFVQKKHESSHRFTGFNPAFPAQWFYGFLRALLGDRLVVTVASWKIPQDLTPAPGRQDHTTSPSASRAVRQKRIRVHRIPCPTSVTIAKRPSGGTGWRNMSR